MAIIKSMLIENHYLLVIEVCRHALAVFDIPKLHFLPMRKQSDQINTKRGYVIGRTNLKTGLITIDIFTPKFRKPKAIASIIRTLAHEVAHHQKPPYRSRFRGHLINRCHYPIFYRQVNRNVIKLKKDKVLHKYFSCNLKTRQFLITEKLKSFFTLSREGKGRREV